MRQQRGLLEHGARRRCEVLDRGRVAELRELVACGPVPELGLVPEREERFAAAGALARACDRQHLVDRHVRALAAPRGPRERAVVADVAAELRERDEDLRAVGDEPPARLAAHAPRLRHQLLERRGEQLHGRELTVETGGRRSSDRKREWRCEMRYLILLWGDREGERALSDDERRAI